MNMLNESSENTNNESLHTHSKQTELQILNEKVGNSKAALPSAPWAENGASDTKSHTPQDKANENVYYIQQRVAGQPVFVHGGPPPPSGNASRLPAYRAREDDTIPRSIDSIFGSTFDEIAIRNQFVQKVYTILAIQLLFTCGLISACIFEPTIKKFVATRLLPLIIAFTIEMIVYFTLVCCVAVRRSYPANFILLGLFTTAFAYIMAFVSVHYSTHIVMLSMGLTAVLCTLISLFACQTSWDVTTCGMFLCIAGLTTIVFGMIALIVNMVTGNRIMFVIYAGLIAFLFSAYLMYDTQMVMGGQRIEISSEEYIFAVLTLYVDIMQIFWALLTLIGVLRN